MAVGAAPASVRPSGGLQIVMKRSWVPDEVQALMNGFRPSSHLGEIVRKCIPLLPFDAAMELVEAITRTAVFESSLSIRKLHNGILVAELGIVSRKVVTTAGVNFLVDALQGSVEPELMRYHGLGTGIDAEAVGDTALQTELTTQYISDNVRATGTLTEGGGANIFRTVATNTLDESATVSEHGILSQAAAGGGILLDRSVFTGLPLISADGLETTYDLTLTAGG